MALKEDLKLFGFFPSPFVHRVIWAFKLKGLEFEYIEEDLYNKSDLLLKYNPVHQKVPVLVHGGRPVAESVVILEYIDETWPEGHRLLPSDPYERAQARFWTNFGEEKQERIFATFFTTTGEEQAKAAKEAREVLDILEKELEGLGEKKYFGGEEVGMVDLEFGWLAYLLEMFEDISGFKIMSEWHLDLPRLKAWFGEFNNLDIVKDTVPEEKKLFAYFKHIREKYIS
ncbi:unnamed protein product [Rhodiola kirilowii]